MGVFRLPSERPQLRGVEWRVMQWPHKGPNNPSKAPQEAQITGHHPNPRPTPWPVLHRPEMLRLSRCLFHERSEPARSQSNHGQPIPPSNSLALIGATLCVAIACPTPISEFSHCAWLPPPVHPHGALGKLRLQIKYNLLHFRLAITDKWPIKLQIVFVRRRLTPCNNMSNHSPSPCLLIAPMQSNCQWNCQLNCQLN